MEDFPKFDDRQVALVRADVNTGHVLYEELKLVIGADQRAYTIFEGAEVAFSYAKRLVKSNIQVECVIYNREKKVLCHIY